MHKKKSFINLGFSSILMVFVTVTFLTFGVLSVLTANADYRLTKKTSTRTAAYYTAENTAEAVTAEIDEALVSIYHDTEDETAYYASASQYFSSSSDLNNTSSLDRFEWNTDADDSHLITFDLRISELQILSVVLAVQYPSSENDYTCYTIREWQTISDSNSTSDTETLHLFGN